VKAIKRPDEIGREGRPKGTTSSVGTTEKMIPIFDGGTTLGRARRGQALEECILLFLEGKLVVDPFDDKQAFEKTERQSALVEGLPVNGIKDVDGC
jgi:hypothetical protein